MQIPPDVYRRLRGNMRLDAAWIESLPIRLNHLIEKLGIDAQTVTFLPHGRGGLTCIALWQGRKVIIKIYDHQSLVEVEHAWHQFMGEVETWKTDDPCVIILGFKDGYQNLRELNLTPEEKIDRVMQESKHWNIHASVPDELFGYSTDHSVFIPNHVDTIMKVRAAGLFDHLPYQLWKDRSQHHQGKLLQGDFSPANILYSSQDDHVILLDPSMMIGDSAYDWAKLIIHLQRISGDWEHHLLERIDRISHQEDKELLVLWVHFFICDRYLYYHAQDNPPQEKMQGWSRMLKLMQKEFFEL